MDTLKILVVDDESRMRKLVKRLFNKEEFCAGSRRWREEAMDIFIRKKILP